jgi:small multidrug resistance pump
MNPITVAYGWLAGAIASEVLGTAFLQKSAQFTRLVPTVVMAAFYAASFYFLSQALRSLPLGIAYAIWGGLGIMFRQMLDAPAILGIALIVSGVIVINIFSTSSGH